jgi:GntP family gluconate:H+ symporter
MIILYLALSIVGIILLSVKLKVHPFLGEPVIALLIGMFLSALLPKKLEAEMFSISLLLESEIMNLVANNFEPRIGANER